MPTWESAEIKAARKNADELPVAQAEAIKRIMVAIEPENDRALKKAVSLAALLHADVRLVHVLEPIAAIAAQGVYSYPDMERDRRLEREGMLNKAVQSVPPQLHPTSDLRDGHAADQIIKAAAEWKADLIVVGRHRRGPLERLFLGSTSKGVIKGAHCGVLVVRDDSPAVAAAKSKAVPDETNRVFEAGGRR